MRSHQFPPYAAPSLLLLLCSSSFSAVDAFVTSSTRVKGQYKRRCLATRYVSFEVPLRTQTNKLRKHFTAIRNKSNELFCSHNDFENGNVQSHSTPNRRKFICQALFGPVLGSAVLLNSNIAQAACLSGDIREECIGVYKMPMDDAALSYVDTPEKLKRYAPDLNWVPPVEYPPTYADAVAQLKEQRKVMDGLQESIAKGELNKGGLMLLDIIPKVTSSGKVILRDLGGAANPHMNIGNSSDSNNVTNPDMKAYRVEYALNEVLGYLGETDIVLGQGLRGQLGASAPAQIQILSSLAEATKEFDELIRAVPEKI